MTPIAETWFAFRAYNSQALYGFGTEAEASQYQDFLNAGRENNHYTVTPLSAEAVAELGLEEGCGDPVALDDELRELANA